MSSTLPTATDIARQLNYFEYKTFYTTFINTATMKLAILTILTLFTTAITAQDVEGCNGERYRDYVTDSVTVIPDIQYGAGLLYPTEVATELYLDVYTPFGDDAVESRPMMIFAFGGSFIEGTRKDIAFMCEDFAKRGYVAVSIDYRLYDGPLFPLPNATTMKNVVIRAVSDMKGAIKYLRQDADVNNTYGIDPDQIYVGGISAGSILACHVAMLDDDDDLPADLVAIIDENGGLEGNSNDITGYSTEVSGLINYSGGLNDASWIDSEDPTFISVHDENDGIVPYGAGFATVFGFPIIAMEGSLILSETADSVGVDNELITFENSLAHVGFLLSETTTVSVFNSTSRFVQELVCPSIVSTTTLGVPSSITVYPNPTTGLIQIQSDTEVVAVDITNSTGSTYAVSMQNKSADLSGLPQGLYTLTIYSSDGTVASQKVVVAAH